MTDLEIRQLKNDRDYWRRVAESYERKYGKCHNKTCVCITRGSERVKGHLRYFYEVTLCQDLRDRVSATNELQMIYDDLCDKMKGKGISSYD